jgi:stearoyl-CoA desaturase (delta-9 desaturase)
MNLLKQGAFWAIHLGCLGVFWVGFSWTAFWTCAALYVVRMFGITGAYHRYFSHRSYDTSRPFQFALGLLGATSAQKGPIWWAAHHRHHHKHSDTEQDIHPPGIYGLWWAHVGWVLSSQFIATREEGMKDLLRYPELRWLDKYHIVPPTALLLLLAAFGSLLSAKAPELHTSAMQMVVWGCISTTLLYHGTFCINSLAHVIGRPRFKTGDDSKNSFLLAIITLGEGWHNNHHRYPGSERQGFYWWELDISHYILKCLAAVGLVWNLRVPPARIYQEALNGRPGAAPANSDEGSAPDYRAAA